MNPIAFSPIELGESDLIAIFVDNCSSHVRLCGEEGVDASHDFFVRLLSMNGWLDDTVSIEISITPP